MATDENEKILIDLVVVKGSGSDPDQHFKIQSITQENVEKAQLVIGQSTFTSGDSPGGGGSITVDSSISSTSTNPVQNKIVKEYVDSSINTAIGNINSALTTLNTGTGV